MNENNVSNQVPQADEEIDDVSASTWHYIFKHYYKGVFWYSVFAVVSCIIAVVIVVNNPILFQLGFIIIAIVATIGMYVYQRVLAVIKVEFTQQLGAELGLTYTGDASLGTVSGKWFTLGSRRSITNVLEGVYKTVPLRIFTYRYVVITDSGDNQSSTPFDYTVFEATLKGTVPDILAFSKKGIQYVPATALGFQDESLRLEGNFNDYFLLYVPKGREQEAYQIFTPDVMAVLIDKASGLHFECVGNKVYIYKEGVITKREVFESLVELAQYLMSLFEKNTAYMVQ